MHTAFSVLDMVEIKDKERAIIEFTCIPEVNIEKAQHVYDIGFLHLRELLAFSLDEEAKVRGLVEILNYKILQHFLTLEADDIPAHKFKCPLCMGTVYGDEEECSDCGALLLEEILEVEIEDVYRALREIIDTIIENPEGAKNFLEKLREGEDDSSEEVMGILKKEIGEQASMERGFIVTSIIPSKKEKNYVIVVSPLGGREEEIGKAFEDFRNLGASESTSFLIEGGNIIHKQEEAVKNVVSKYLSESDLRDNNIDSLYIINLKIAKFMEEKATVIIEDNRHFLSSIDEIEADDPQIEGIKNMLYDVKLIKEARKIGENFILDGTSFNNDPITFLLVKECLPILKKNNDLDIRILDVVVNTSFVGQGNHNDLVRLLREG